MHHTYEVIAFRQQESSPIQVAFVAHAADVLQWAGIPRKREELLTGYQRFLDEARVEQQIAPFFATPENCSPTAVIVALRKDSTLGSCILANENVAAGEVVHTTLNVQFNDAAVATDELFQSALAYVNHRLTSSKVEPGIRPPNDTTGDDDDATDEDFDGDDENGDNNIVHLGTSTLEHMKCLLECVSNWTNPNFRESITEYVKPAMLIDGQHRIAGAAKIGRRGLPFVICGLYDVPWTEQVFQFTVVNLKPKRLPPSTITAIAGLSLTRSEQDSVEERLRQAGVRIGEVAMMSLVAYDDASPFSNAIDMNVGSPSENQSKLGYTVVKRMATPWYRATRKSFTLIAKDIFSTNNQNNARVQWRETRLWFTFFCAFWGAVRRKYTDELWQRSESNHLFIGATLWGLQEAILTQVDAQRRATWAIDEEVSASESDRAELLLRKFLEPVNEALDCIPIQIWTCRWKRQPEDTTAGRRELVTLFSRIINEGQALGGVWNKWRKLGDWFE